MFTDILCECSMQHILTNLTLVVTIFLHPSSSHFMMMHKQTSVITKQSLKSWECFKLKTISVLRLNLL